uniref:Uncharacterized protein n=1 Tax=Clastoptera arizonana TaxID=38151 RepID=A0A1B6CMH5_9HEMI
MSKDIKSYFLSTNKSKSEEHNNKKIVDTRKSSKKKRVFIESDSDEEKPQPKKANNSSFQINKNEVLPTRSKYFEVCTPENVFGNKPIKRIPTKKTIKKTSDIGMELDDDFEATLMQMSEVDADELKEKSKQNNWFKKGYVVDTNSDQIKNKPSLLSKDPINNCSLGEFSHMAKFKNASSSSNKIDNTNEVLNTQPDKLLDKEIQIKESCGINSQNIGQNKVG